MTNEPSHRMTRDQLACVLALTLSWLFICGQDRFGPMARRCDECRAAIAAYRRLCEENGVADHSCYHRQLSSIYDHYGLIGDAYREWRIAERTVQRGTRD